MAKQNIKFVGLELEGFWKDGHNDLKEDGSVSFNDHECDQDIDNCCCFDDCSCDSCVLCSGCHQIPDNCHCMDCVYCRGCDNQIDDCSCDRGIEKLRDCTNTDCTDLNICDNCVDYCDNLFLENREIYRNCQDFDYNCDRNCDCSCDCSCCNHIGEVTSSKIKIDEAENFILDNYPNRVNASCGFHIHFSFTDNYRSVMKLCDPNFQAFLINELNKWGNKNKINEDSRFWRRLNSENKFCQNSYVADDQLDRMNSDRYYFVNFNSYHKHKTIEVRVGTMFNDKKIAVKYFHALCDIINDFLNNHAQNVLDREILVKTNKIECQIKINVTKDGIKIYSKANGLNLKKYKTDRVLSQGKYFTCHDINYLYFKNKEFSNFFLNHDDDGQIPNLSFLTLKNIQKGKSIHLKNKIISYSKLNEYCNLIENSIIEGLKICV